MFVENFAHRAVVAVRANLFFVEKVLFATKWVLATRTKFLWEEVRQLEFPELVECPHGFSCERTAGC